MRLGGCGHTCDKCLAKDRAERKAKRNATMSQEDAAQLLGRTLAKIAGEDVGLWLERVADADRLGLKGVSRRSYIDRARRYGMTAIHERGGPAPSLAGRVLRYFNTEVQEAAGNAIVIRHVCDRVQIDPKDPK
jgi:hypothetical protein